MSDRKAFIGPVVAALAPTIAGAVIDMLVKRQDVAVNQADAQVIRPGIESIVKEKLADGIPPKPATSSTTIHGIIVGGLGLVASFLGLNDLAPEDYEFIVTTGGQVVTAIGLIWAALGRRKAVQPLGA